MAEASAALSTGVVAFGILAAGACTPVSPTPGTASPTSTPLPPAPLAEARTAVSAAATAVSPQVDYVLQVLRGILGSGVQVQIEQDPPGASNSQVTNVRVRATDTSGAFARLDRDGREKTAEVVLFAAGQFYPQATVDLLIVDGADHTLLTGSRAPGQAARLDD